ncbi:hypothetical protein ARMSODRAFT_1024117 [Armillaria solidipes]|uniref:Uncharacterized protein n=1 Tax=Armillaria solidipes TaxID=1076256 RepID=A0A2H3B8P3_9AGAR|nr:hypothetical protein ARMSODRAFT_1024117 [Armillaria solidipes]
MLLPHNEQKSLIKTSIWTSSLDRGDSSYYGALSHISIPIVVHQIHGHRLLFPSASKTLSTSRITTRANRCSAQHSGTSYLRIRYRFSSRRGRLTDRKLNHEDNAQDDDDDDGRDGGLQSRRGNRLVQACGAQRVTPGPVMDQQPMSGKRDKD